MEFLSHFRVLLQRFDAETCDDEETSNENSETTSFITQLATWQKQVLYTMYCIPEIDRSLVRPKLLPKHSAEASAEAASFEIPSIRP